LRDEAPALPEPIGIVDRQLASNKWMLGAEFSLACCDHGTQIAMAASLCPTVHFNFDVKLNRPSVR
jgi:glutathione S-transferase